MTTVAALLTCHDRVERTLGCLDSLARQRDLTGIDVEVVLVDAGSTDGTREAVAARFPAVTIVERGADLFWNGGMRVAHGHAARSDPDHYLWLNDDVVLDDDALARLLATHDQLATRPSPCIVVGSTRDPVSGELTYGGVVRPDRWRPLYYEVLPPDDRVPREVETMNGNCVLVPRGVAARIGTLAAAYTHGMGDYDYGHRAARAGCEVWVVPGTIGTCARNPEAPRAATLGDLQRRVTGTTTGLPPAEWVAFARRWAGPLWPVYAASPYLRTFAAWARGR